MDRHEALMRQRKREEEAKSLEAEFSKSPILYYAISSYEGKITSSYLVFKLPRIGTTASFLNLVQIDSNGKLVRTRRVDLNNLSKRSDKTYNLFFTKDVDIFIDAKSNYIALENNHHWLLQDLDYFQKYNEIRKKEAPSESTKAFWSNYRDVISLRDRGIISEKQASKIMEDKDPFK